MNNDEIIKTICGGLFGLAVFIAFSLMFGWAAWKGDFIFHYVRIRGKLARVIGIVGLLLIFENCMSQNKAFLRLFLART